MREILDKLPAASLVLDLGSGTGSFDAARYPFTVIRADLDAAPGSNSNFVICSAEALPFRNHAFQALISNHSLEHFHDLNAALREIGRVLDSGGALFVAVPDATTITDRLYRSLARGGGHVNPFTSAPELASRIAQVTCLSHVATRTLCTSLSFLNRHNIPTRPPKRLMLMGGGTETSLRLLNGLFRMSDRFLGTRTSVYGWAFYFGNVQIPIDCTTWTNVCLRCGSGHPSNWLRERGIGRRFRFLPIYRCPNCDTSNLFSDDAHFTHLLSR